MIEVHGLVKSFEGTPALRGLDLHVPRGAVYGLVGPNGAGKSTLLRCLAGVFRPDSGTVLVDGQPVWENPAVKGHIAFIPDELYYFVTASLLDMKRFYQGFYPTFDAALFDRLGEIFPLDPRRPMRHLSKGVQKQAAFWLALSLRPRIMLLDEPVDGLDPVMRRRLWSLLMNQVEQRELTVLISSHNLRELEDVCDHVGVLSEGALLLERSLSQLQEDFVKLQIVFRPQGPCTLAGLPILHESVAGRIHTLILRCGEEQAVRAAQALDPVFYDVLPLTLEEIFIYELGGADDGLKDLVL